MLIIAVPFLAAVGWVAYQKEYSMNILEMPPFNPFLIGWFAGILSAVLFCLLIKWGGTALKKRKPLINNELGGLIIAIAVFLPLVIIAKHFIGFSIVGFATGGASLGTGIGLFLTGEISLKEEKPLIAQLRDTWKQRTARRQ
ncbi:MAG: hypothetical protein ABFD64_04965 [Armatimonadota bacterium]